MQAYLNTRFFRGSIEICRILNETDTTINSHPDPSSPRASATIEAIRAQRRNLIRANYHRLPEPEILTQLCQWIKEIEDADYSFADFAEFLDQWNEGSALHNNNRQPDKTDFIIFHVVNKHFSTLD
jgi:hypothetical protein